MDSKNIRMAITKIPGLYFKLAPFWRKINRGALAKLQYFFIFRDYDKQRHAMDSAVPLWNSIEIETFNRCNGDCPFCPVNRNADSRPPVKMEEGLFRKIIDELGELNYKGVISLFSNNEPYLDGRIFEFMKYARERIPSAFINIYTNGTLLTMDKYLRSIVYLDELFIDNYDDRGELSENAKRIKAYCASHPEARKKTFIALRKKNEVLTSRGGSAPNKRVSEIQTLPCFLPFTQMVIRPDGKCSLCCNDALGKITMGDVNESSLLDIWNSAKYKKVRRMLRQSRRNISICRYCDTVTTTK